MRRSSGLKREASQAATAHDHDEGPRVHQGDGKCAFF